uniref:Chorismate dehydratase n=1 Tax=uncultured bacterium A1Q1_fos_2037 TaxID=1256558 RepID=L7W1J4_9BACT|nr:menaquinone via futalosine step 1 [uncultured bacterium A1Q1_fos_2037]
MTQIRVGIVNYINSRPLSRGLLRGWQERGFACESLPPAVIADRLRAGTLDVGLVPSIELARIPGLRVIPGLAIAATHEVRSVLLVSKVPVGEIASVALDENSRTSAALVRMILKDRYGLEPAFRPARADIEAMLAAADAALIIGDPALTVPRERHVVLDLAGEWLEMTGLPFVFAVWAAREEVAIDPLVAPFTTSLETGLAELDAIVAETAAETGLSPAVLRDYFTRNLSYRMGPAEQAGLTEFLRRAESHGLSPAPAILRFASADS